MSFDVFSEYGSENRETVAQIIAVSNKRGVLTIKAMSNMIGALIIRSINSVGECHLDMVEVVSSILTSTIYKY